jgi:p-aminobenzoyl-glutamate transporter AbgT
MSRHLSVRVWARLHAPASLGCFPAAVHGLFPRALDAIERVGNRRPDPITIFLILSGVMLALTAALFLVFVCRPECAARPRGDGAGAAQAVVRQHPPPYLFIPGFAFGIASGKVHNDRDVTKMTGALLLVFYWLNWPIGPGVMMRLPGY